ncbi:MAG: low molecular weight protein-tyrosine-phosphatase [Rhodospirillaceae bacterium]
MSDFAVLFVCTGNICRSPTADGVFRAKLAAEGLTDRVLVDSAGTGAWHVGEAPDPRTRQAAKGRGYDLDPLRARQVTRSDFDRFDLLLGMDRSHVVAMDRMAGSVGDREKVALFMNFAAEAPGGSGTDAIPQRWIGADMPDPYYGGADGFGLVLDMVEAGCDGLIEHIKTALKAP